MSSFGLRFFSQEICSKFFWFRGEALGQISGSTEGWPGRTPDSWSSHRVCRWVGGCSASAGQGTIVSQTAGHALARTRLIADSTLYLPTLGVLSRSGPAVQFCAGAAVVRHPSLTAEAVCAGSSWRGAGLLGTSGLGAGNQLPFPFRPPLVGSWEHRGATGPDAGARSWTVPSCSTARGAPAPRWG